MDNQVQQQNPVTNIPAESKKKMPKKVLIILGFVVLLILLFVVLQASKSKTAMTQTQPVSTNTMVTGTPNAPQNSMAILTPAPVQINSAKDLNTAMANVKNLDPKSINTAVSQNNQLSSGFQQ